MLFCICLGLLGWEHVFFRNNWSSDATVTAPWESEISRLGILRNGMFQEPRWQFLGAVGGR